MKGISPVYSSIEKFISITFGFKILNLIVEMTINELENIVTIPDNLCSMKLDITLSPK